MRTLFCYGSCFFFINAGCRTSPLPDCDNRLGFGWSRAQVFILRKICRFARNDSKIGDLSSRTK